MTFATPHGSADPPGPLGPLGQLGQLGLGAANLYVRGPAVAFEVLDAWAAAGGRLIDTAASYGAGESERTVGAWLRERGARDGVVLLTKAGHPDPSYRHNRVTPEIIEADLAGSLRRLGVPWVDILLVHRDDPAVPVAVIIETLAAQVAAGRARAYGVSNWTLPRLDEALAYVDGHGLLPLAWSSSYLGLASPVEPAWPGVVDANDEASRAWYASRPVRLLAWSPVANGFFSASADLTEGRFDAYRTPANLARRERASELAARRGVTTSQIALAWVLCQPFSPVAPIGTTSTAHLAEAIGAAEIRLTSAELHWLEHGDGDHAGRGAVPAPDREEAAWTS